MSLTFKTGINWTKLAIALALMCSMFSFSPMAHTKQEGPLDAEAVSALIEELTDGLQDVIKDEDQVAAITEKWDAHEDLVGKTRTQILKLLFADVKSVIEDKETQDNIWASWTGGEESNDETPVKTPAPAPPPAQAPAPPPAPPPAQTPKPNVWIKIIHDGFYIGHFDVSWDEPGKPNNTWKQYGKTRGWQDTIALPGDATNIRLKIQNDTGLVWQPQREIFNRVLQPSDLNKCYRVTGTTLSSGYDNNCQ
jgi:hypothetical protein